MEVWVEVFQIEPIAEALDFSVGQHLVWVAEEVSRFDKEMRHTTLSEAVFGKPRDSLRSLISLLLLQGTVQRLKLFCSTEVRSLLHACSDALPDEEEPLDREAVDKLKSLIAELKKLAGDAQLSPDLVDIVLRHLTLLERAVDALPIRGVAALNEAVRSALGEMFFRDGQAKDMDEKSKPGFKTVVAALKRTWKGVLGVIETTEKIQKGIELTHEALEFFDNVSP